MNTTTAKVEHRDFVPYGWLAIEFCEVFFTGKESLEMNKKWSDMKNEQYQKHEKIANKYEKEKEELTENIKEIQNTIRKPWFRFWYNKEEKSKLEEIQKKNTEIENLTNLIKEEKDDRFFSATIARLNIESMLNENGFVLMHTSSSGDECVTHTDIWIKEDKE